jgi:large subunit ribosomal protein L5
MRQNRLKRLYTTKVVTKLREKFRYSNVHCVPRLTKIVINRGLGNESQNAKSLELSSLELTQIAAQCVVVNRARKAISGFGIRAKIPLGISVTLRSERIYSFYDRLVNLALPRIQDFKGVSASSFDKFGNYNIGLKEQVIFPEIRYDQIDRLSGIDLSIVSTSVKDEDRLFLLRGLGIPFQNYPFLVYDKRYS